ncbi:putative mpv17 pmp22 family protein [Eutypa lata UCREL1]|uniref:Putative mpv17 pmp22 family protein n=1 Tax=Eutypa lata (strain UCR-EL1) TaxID=1287681 RepID=M7SQ53_EUTLA|nr:putative mpv17 pmp22 family protein [Eutypa lata UCREL1]
MASSFFRVAFRRHLEQFRIRRLPQSSRRHQSSGPTSEAKKAKVEDPIPVPNTVAPLPFWQRLGPLTRAGQAYARAQRRRPWGTQLATTLVIYFCADISAQRMSGNGFMWLSHHFNYPSHILSIAVKVAVNQTCFTPLFNTYFFGAQALLSGDTLAETWERVRRTVPVSCANSLKLWPAVTAFSFTYVPLEYRSVFAGVVAVGWQTYLSFLNRQAELREDGEKKLVAAVTAASVGNGGNRASANTTTATNQATTDPGKESRRVPA